MPDLHATIRTLLARGPQSSRALQQATASSQATVSRALSALGAELVRVGRARSTIYSLRDSWPESPQLPVWRVDEDGRLHTLGELLPVRPAGFVFQGADGEARFSDGMPWWMADLRPQGFLGRAFAQRHAAALGLPPSLADWSDRHVLRALSVQGDDLSGNLLVGEPARQRFLGAPTPEPMAAARRSAAYAVLAGQALAGDVAGSSAAGEQPKFTALVESSAGPQHVIVKFNLPQDDPASRRWHDLLLAEQLALQTLRDTGLPAAGSRLLEHGPQRFLEVARFDRIGAAGRRALHSLASLDDGFVGDRSAPWPQAVARLVAQGLAEAAALPVVQRLYAFGVLIANSDMHMGNLAFFSAPGRPCTLAPAFDMLPMALAPTPAGAVRNTVADLHLPASVPLALWHPALAMAQDWLRRLQAAARARQLSEGFGPALEALRQRLLQATQQVARIAP